MTLLEGVNYFLAVLFLAGGVLAIIFMMTLLGERLQRNACRRRHPAYIGRVQRIARNRRAVLNRKGRG